MLRILRRTFFIKKKFGEKKEKKKGEGELFLYVPRDPEVPGISKLYHVQEFLQNPGAQTQMGKKL